jgi:hypothetical protein
MWYLKGRSLISENQRYSTDLINVVSTPSSPIPPVTWDTTHLREWLFAKGFGEGLFGGICSLCYQAIADAYVVPSSFALSNDGRTILEDGPRNYRTGPNVIRNYSANPLEFHQGFKTLETERRAYVSTVDWGKLLLRNKNAIRGDIIDSTMYLGIELEVTPNRNTFDYLRYRFGQSTPPDFQREGTNFASSIAERFLRKKALGIVKSDSSTQYGFEIVTVPGTLAWHRQQWQGFFKEDYPLHLQFLAPASWMAGWVNNGLTIKRPPWVHQDTTANHITPYCGIHIHVSRASLTPLQFGKILTFMGDPKNASFVQTIAGRKDSDYAKFYPKKISEGYKLNPSLINTAANLGRTGVSTYDDRRYSAVNIVSDKPTIEFRIFRSNIAKGGFMKNLDFVHAFCTWCKNVSMQELNVSHFIKFVEENKGTYPWLYRYLVTTKQTDSKHKFNPAVAFNLEEHI